MRTATIERNTKETQISLALNLDGAGAANVNSGCGFLDHMLTLFARHGRMDLFVKSVGDINVDFHHTVEDVGICLGLAFEKALGEKKGIKRYGNTILPMDEALILSAVDISGRALLVYDMDIPAEKVGDFDTELGEEFFQAFVRNAKCTLHFCQMAGVNSHHILEGAFKSVARTLAQAVEIDARFANEVPSTKGVL